jgi:hypothetical protein
MFNLIIFICQKTKALLSISIYITLVKWNQFIHISFPLLWLSLIANTFAGILKTLHSVIVFRFITFWIRVIKYDNNHLDSLPCEWNSTNKCFISSFTISHELKKLGIKLIRAGTFVFIWHQYSSSNLPTSLKERVGNSISSNVGLWLYSTPPSQCRSWLFMGFRQKKNSFV